MKVGNFLFSSKGNYTDHSSMPDASNLHSSVVFN